MSGAAEPALQLLESGGLNLSGVLSGPGYDERVPPGWTRCELLPQARAVLVLASGGRALWSAFCSAPEAGLSRDPLDRYTRRLVEEAAARLPGASRAVFSFEAREGRFADFVALARAAGLGSPSRLGLLLHPRYGPWMSIRAALLTEVELPETPADPGFDPCTGCPAPCAAACPASAPTPGGFDLAACTATRSSERDCALRCAARRGCRVGPEHAYAPEAEAFHFRAADRLRGACRSARNVSHLARS